ncbi:unnamed protein product [Phytophthora fragariaefolia]|uniref:Unnamed protein product n=1 Tax=Phytophthora fragariaefolia TaxID=1490495 RepID=A0A9W7D7D4_9STRA|nr:unnamed protein product [Phytophthora fragariaefolia]
MHFQRLYPLFLTPHHAKVSHEPSSGSPSALESRLGRPGPDSSMVELAGTEIHDLQTEYADVERDLEDSEEQRRILEGSLDHAQAALRQVEAELVLTQDLIVRPQASNTAAQERDQALASATEANRRASQLQEDLEARQRTYNDTVAELNRLRAVHTATLADLDREVAGRAASNRSAEEIQDRHRVLEADRDSLQLRYEAACRERDVARRQLSIVATVIGAPSQSHPEENSATPKRPREASGTLGPESPPSKRRPLPRDTTDSEGRGSARSRAHPDGEIDDDGGRDPEGSDLENLEASEEAATSGGTGSSVEGKNVETADVADELFEAQTLEAPSQSRYTERRRQYASSRRSNRGESGDPPGGSDDSDSEGAPDPHDHDRDPAIPPTNPLVAASTFAPSNQCIPGRDRPRALGPADCDPWQSPI